MAVGPGFAQQVAAQVQGGIAAEEAVAGGDEAVVSSLHDGVDDAGALVGNLARFVDGALDFGAEKELRATSKRLPSREMMVSTLLPKRPPSRTVTRLSVWVMVTGL